MSRKPATVKTTWWHNIEQDTFHEVIAGSDHEKRIRKAQIETGEEGEFRPLYEPSSEAEAFKAAGLKPPARRGAKTGDTGDGDQGDKTGDAKPTGDADQAKK